MKILFTLVIILMAYILGVLFSMDTVKTYESLSVRGQAAVAAFNQEVVFPDNASEPEQEPVPAIVRAESKQPWLVFGNSRALALSLNHGEEILDAWYRNGGKDLPSWVYAIYRMIPSVEGAPNGLEWGIVAPKCPRDWESQAGWGAATVVNNYKRFVMAGNDPEDREGFITYLGSRYAPVGADNDPTDLNRNWIPNMLEFMKHVE